MRKLSNFGRPRRRSLVVRQSGGIANILFSVGILVVAALVFIYRQDIKDWLILQQYKPTAAIQQLADAAALSPHGKQEFYVSQPELHGKTDFSQKCQNVGDKNSNVLGCYVAQRIYIFDVQDQQLSGVREVTAAHEMLHAAYERLSANDRQHVDDLIKQQLNSRVDDHIKQLIDLYNRLEPGEMANEMHSILGTEQATLSPELEQYYSQYFTDRKKVVSLAATYQAVFDDLKAKQQTLANQLDDLANQINSGTASLNRDVASFNADVQSFNAKAGSGSMTQAEFDGQRAALVERKNNLNSRRDDNEALRQQYQDKQDELKSLAIQFDSLQAKVDSKPDSLTNVQ